MTVTELDPRAPSPGPPAHPLVLEATERRLAAVWFADIVGFTALTCRDEEAALGLVALLQATAQRIVPGHGGTLVKFTGDGMLAYATSTSDALTAALGLVSTFGDDSRRSGRPASLRVGMHVGDLVIASDGDVYGDGVNIASRLEGEARPGRIVVSEDVQRQCRQRDDLRFVPIGPRRLKGLDEPVWAYEVAPPGQELAAAIGIPTERPQEAPSIAVLPFEVLGGGEDVAILAAGLHNDLVADLSKVPELTVISRKSVMRYRDTDEPVPRIARELDVDTVVEGAIQAAGHRVRLTVQLVDGVSGSDRWVETCDRELAPEDLFTVQSELSALVTGGLRAELVGGRDDDDRPTSPQSADTPTVDVEAYRLATQARQQFELRTRSSMTRAVELFERAVALDPEYADAWVGLADALALIGDYAGGEDQLCRAELAVYRALALDPGSAGAHASLGLLFSRNRFGVATIREFEYAIALQPSYADAHNWLAWISLVLGRAEPALASACRAVELNPLSAEPVSNLALAFLATGQPERALVVARRAGELSTFTTAALVEGLALLELGRSADAVAVVRPLVDGVGSDGRTVPWVGSGPEVVAALGRAACGAPDAARTTLGALDGEDRAFSAGLVLLGLGEVDEASRELGRVEEMGPWPCLALHHLFGDVWRPIVGTSVHDHLLAVSRTSWRLDAEDPQ